MKEKEKILNAMSGFEHGGCMEDFAQVIADIEHSDEFVANFVITIMELQEDCDYYQL